MRIFRKTAMWLMVTFLLLIGSFISACGSTSLGANGSSHTLKVVAAENFYGDIAKQLGGQHVSVTSILSNPNVDPHEYQSNAQTSITVGQADLVIENGAGYDGWMDQILASTPNSQRLLLKGYDNAGIHLPENVHVWYSFENAAMIAQAITADLKILDPTDTSNFNSNLQMFKQSLQPLQQKVAAIKARYNGTPVGLTETIYLYQTELEGLQVLTPFEFEKAIAEGNDPPADTVISATDQINQRQIKVLIYNEQTVTPVTTNLENLAQTKHIPIVPVTETMPPNKTYQTWMMDQLNTLQVALGG
ncbi:MAG: metal ABC transporter solute-binding protein, Zn/Mn family [Ktedonobacteraceae bacterium]